MGTSMRDKEKNLGRLSVWDLRAWNSGRPQKCGFGLVEARSLFMGLSKLNK